MGYVTARTSVTFELQNNDQFTYNGRTITFFPAEMLLRAADRYQQQTWQISAGISAQALDISPLGVSAQAGMTFFLASEPVDMRFGSAGVSALLSAVTMMSLGGSVSSLFVSTSNVTQIWLFTAGGSGAQLVTTVPNP